MTIHHKDVEQGSEEWKKLRACRFTASNASTIAASGAGLETLCREMLVSKLSSGKNVNFSSEDTERGNELEPLAIGIYEMRTCSKVERVGFIEKDEYVGCSPDGLIGKVGLIEVKSKKDSNYLKTILTNKADAEHVAQAQHQMMVTQRQWCDIAYYNPNFEYSLHIIRVYADEKYFEKLMLGIERGKRLLREYEDYYRTLLNGEEDQIAISYPSGRLVQV